MKKFITLLSCLLLCNLAIFGQNEVGSISYGLKLGATSAWISPTEEYSSVSGSVTSEQVANSRFSINGGVYLEYIYTDRLRFRGEVLYTSKGVNMSTSKIAPTYRTFNDYSYPLNYVEIPLLTTYSFEHPQFTPYILGGLAPSFMISTPKVSSKQVQQDGNGKMISESTEEKAVSPDPFNKFDIGLVIGAGIVLPKGLGAELRYTIGQSAISDSNTNPTNKYLGLTLFYRIK